MEKNEIILHRYPRNFEPTSAANATIFKGEQDGGVTSADIPKMVAFDAYRNKPFHEEQKYVTFDGTEVNAGGAFNPETGKVSQSIP